MAQRSSTQRRRDAEEKPRTAEKNNDGSSRRGYPEVKFKEAEVGQFYFWIYPRAAEPYKFHKRCLVLCGRDDDGDHFICTLYVRGTQDLYYYTNSGLAGKLYGPVFVPLS